MSAKTPNPALNLAPFSRWTLRDKAAQRRLALRWASQVLSLLPIRSALAIVVCLASTACISTDADSPQPLPAQGTVVAERWADLRFGFREVARSQVNPPGAFEGIGHFVFVYFGDEKLCQCSRREVAIAPDGSRVLYTDVVGGKLMLFVVAGKSRVELTQEFVGYPTSAVWDLAARKVVVTLAHGTRPSITLSL